MNILGITSGTHSSGIAHLKDGKPHFAFEEERFCRVKNHEDHKNNWFRYPYQSGQNAPKMKGFDWKRIDYIASFWDLKQVEQMWYGIGLGPFPSEKYRKVDHHEAHCHLAYYCSGFKEPTLVMSLDGGGEEYYGRFYLGQKGNLKYLDGIHVHQKSLGQYYCMLTELLGWRSFKDEGKVVGLSSHGQYVDWIYNAFNDCIKVKGHNTDDCNKQIQSKKIYDDFYKLFVKYNPRNNMGPHGYSKEDIAYNGQLVFEEKILQIIQSLKEEVPQVKNIALSGGVFANVKLNKKINELDWVEEVFITPAMDDNGLPLACALTLHKKLNSNFQPFKLKDTFLGVGVDNFDYDESLFLERPCDLNEIAHDLKDGKIIGWFNGRHEHGPRALCNRSIIANPSIPGTYKKINDRLQRNDNMPFAPVVMDKYAEDVFDCKKSKYTAEFMTMLYDTKTEWQEKIPAVVHPIDKTARIQIIKNSTNPKFYSLINRFNDITGIPVLLNTSFNVHGEPIVCHPQEAFVHLSNNIVDKLVIGDRVFTKK